MVSNSYKLLLKQHIGAPAVPVVTPGVHVQRGQVLATAAGLGAHVHASVSGTVQSITDTCIEITADPVQETGFMPLTPQSSIADTVKEAGLVGMGGAGFPTHVKLSTDLKGGVVIANAVECEPLLAHNIEQILKEPQKIRRGLLLAMESTHASRGIFAIKAKNAKAIAAFQHIVQPSDNIEIHALPDLYPMGEERAIIRETLGVLLSPDDLPVVAGAVILNVETLARIAEAVDELRPVMTKNITVVGSLERGPQAQVFMDVPLGISVQALLNRAGGAKAGYGEIIMGGPFTGTATTLDSVVTKTSGGLIVTMEFMKEKRPLGLLVCACSATEERLRDIATKMHGQVVGVQKCKQAKEGRGGALKCENPGNCPGQAEKIMELRKAGAQVLLVGNCSDCTNTVMCVAPKLKMPVYHITDHVMRTVGHAMVRRLPLEK